MTTETPTLRPVLLDSKTPQREIFKQLDALGWSPAQFAARGHQALMMRSWRRAPDTHDRIDYVELHHHGMRSLLVWSDDEALWQQLNALPFALDLEEALQTLLNTTDPLVALRWMGLIEVIAPSPRYKNELLRLVERFRADPQLLVRRAMYEALYSVGRAEVGAILAPLLSSQDEQLAAIVASLREHLGSLTGADEA